MECGGPVEGTRPGHVDVTQQTLRIDGNEVAADVVPDREAVRDGSQQPEIEDIRAQIELPGEALTRENLSQRKVERLRAPTVWRSEGKGAGRYLEAICEALPADAPVDLPQRELRELRLEPSEHIGQPNVPRRLLDGPVEDIDPGADGTCSAHRQGRPRQPLPPQHEIGVGELQEKHSTPVC